MAYTCEEIVSSETTSTGISTTNSSSENGSNASEKRAFWLDYLKTMPAPLDIAWDKSDGSGRGAAMVPIGEIHQTFHFAMDLPSICEDLTTDTHTSAALLLYSAWLTVLSRWGRSEEMVCGVGMHQEFTRRCAPTFRREQRYIESMAQIFPQVVLPMHVVLDNDSGMPPTALSFCNSLVQGLQCLRQATQKFGPVDYADILASLGTTTAEVHPVFQTAFVVGSAVEDEKLLKQVMTVASVESAPLALQLRVWPLAIAQRQLQCATTFLG
jgi:hypothetical protein